MRFLQRIPAASFLVVSLLLTSAILSSLPRALADSGGPDPYGYTWRDSKFPNPGLTYGWLDGVTGGRDLRLDDDNCTTSKVSFGFGFKFYGVIYNNASVCANGFIAFDIPAGRAGETNAFVAGLDADLDPNATGGGHVFVKADTLSSPRQFIITWNGVYSYGTADPQRFEIVLIENLLEMERAIDRSAQQVAARLSLGDPMAIDVVIGYLTRKAAEVSNLRVIAHAKLLGLPADAARAEITVV